MAEENKEENKVDGYGVINYRLSAIEQQLKELTQLLIKVPIMNNDIKDLEKRVTSLESNQILANDKIQVLEKAPLQDKASKWQSTLDTIYKIFLTAAVGLILVKIGLN